MRIHRLEISAFGPFAATERIDFDRLSAHGLFLLNGATGAGKTSVLDAICFALYGSVPGARQDGKRLRSDHAEAAAEPRVTCEFSATGRHFEVSRSPAWDKPSARGKNGFTVQQANTLLRERVDGEWIEKSGRNDEAGAEIADVLGHEPGPVHPRRHAAAGRLRGVPAFQGLRPPGAAAEPLRHPAF